MVRQPRNLGHWIILSLQGICTCCGGFTASHVGPSPDGKVGSFFPEARWFSFIVKVTNLRP